MISLKNAEVLTKSYNTDNDTYKYNRLELSLLSNLKYFINTDKKEVPIFWILR